MIELLLEWLRKRYFEAAREGNSSFPQAVEMSPRVAFQRGREMAFYSAHSFVKRHADAPESLIRANFHNMHTASIYLDDGQFTRGFNEAALEIKEWLATHHA